MKVVLVVIAALVTLGLAAVGVVAAQKSGFSSQPTERVARAAAAADPVKSVPPAAPARLSPIRDADMPAAMTAAPPATTAPAAAPAAPALPAAASVTPAPPVPPAPQRVAENTAKPAAAAPAANANAAPPAAPGIGACDRPGGMGLARIVEIDTTGGPGFGFQHFKQYDFLRTGEVVLTFDDGPWPENTPAVLKALSDNCLKATFFEIGQHAMWHPEIAKQVAAGGNTVGTHTWSHKDLAKNPYASDTEQAKQEIEMGISAVHMAVAAPISPFFRFPALQHPPEMVTYLGNRNIAIFSCDLDSFDFKASKPEKVVDTVMKKLDSKGKGIILMHDFQKHTAEALPELLNRLKAGGFKVVAMRAKSPVSTLPEYDQELLKDAKLPTVSQRPVNSVVTTVSE